ncbi:MAG: peptidoglycan-binding domain-containing protein, partial [Agrobacterium sp.]|uniref:peptidoglycan-binding domain-containing protein n=1 Tax=Agrobacterium sp. TaxID=361 RepID=UPI004038327E
MRRALDVGFGKGECGFTPLCPGGQDPHKGGDREGGRERPQKRGLYEGDADGRMGPKTAAAIMFFEETLGMEQ